MFASLIIPLIVLFRNFPASSGQIPSPSFPLQIVADIKITAHLIEESSEYPPRYRDMKIYYDYIGKRARADISEGYEAAKTYIRRYDIEKEYMVRYPPIEDCKRSYLGDEMPFPDIPDTLIFKETVIINGLECNHFIHSDFDINVHIYLSIQNGSPVRLVQETVENGLALPLLTYDYSSVFLGPIHEQVFEIPGEYTHETCDWHVGGFPYLHIFHYFVRF